MNNHLFYKIIFVILILSNLSLFSKDILDNKCGFHHFFDDNSKEKFLRKIDFKPNSYIPNVNHRIVYSPKGIFAIHFDTTGFNSPSLIDNNQNGIPDYIDSVAYYFDYVYTIQVNEMGYRSPFPDDGMHGSDHYDIYIWDLGNSDDINDPSVDYDIGGTYGTTFPIGNNPNDPHKFYSFIIIDNDFSPTDSVRIRDSIGVLRKVYPSYSETGINALKVTAAHEFQHAIQLMYSATNITIMEMCGVAMETRIFEDSKDYLQYVKNIFSELSTHYFARQNPHTGYGFSIFAKYLYLNYGDTFLRRMWELIPEYNSGYEALYQVFKEKNLIFRDEWLQFTEWIYHTGSRSIDGKYFPNSKELPELKFGKSSFYTNPSSTLTKGLRPLEIGAIRFLIGSDSTHSILKSDDTLDVIYSNTDIYSAIDEINPTYNYAYSLSNQNTDNCIYIESIRKYFKNFSDTNIVESKLFVYPGIEINTIDYAFPNPFDPKKENIIYFPAPKNSKLYEEATLIVYTPDMLPILTIKDKTSFYNETVVIPVSNFKLNNGIYIYSIQTKNNYNLGKIVVIRN